MPIEVVMLSNYLIFCHPFSTCLQSFPASGSFPVIQLFTSGGQSIGASTSARALAMTIQIDFLWDWLDCSPCGPRDSKESSPAPQFESISSSELSFLHCPMRWPVRSLGGTLVAFALPHSVSKARFACYSKYFLTPFLCISVSYNEKDIFYGY